jgi:hypothetical protein
VNANPKAFFDAEVMHVWTLGLAPYADEKFKRNFRHNSFFITDNTREAVNTGLADYSSIFFSQIPSLFYRGMVKVDVALIQTSAPDEYGYVSLGISVDIVKAAVENAKLVIAQAIPSPQCGELNPARRDEPPQGWPVFQVYSIPRSACVISKCYMRIPGSCLAHDKIHPHLPFPKEGFSLPSF